MVDSVESPLARLRTAHRLRAGILPGSIVAFGVLLSLRQCRQDGDGPDGPDSPDSPDRTPFKMPCVALNPGTHCWSPLHRQTTGTDDSIPEERGKSVESPP